MNEQNFNIFTAINAAVGQLENFHDDSTATYIQNLTKVFSGQLDASDFNDSIMACANKRISDLFMSCISSFDEGRYSSCDVVGLYLISTLLNDPENIKVLSQAILTSNQE